MNTTNIVLLSTIINIAGRWAQGKTLTVKIGVGALFAALGLSAIANYNADLGKDLAMLILVASILYNGPAVFGAVGKATK